MTSLANKPKPEQDKKGRFVSGNSGGGRPKGSRNLLGEAFIADLYADWGKHGLATVQEVREKSPVDYLKVVASLLPRDEDGGGGQAAVSIVNVITWRGHPGWKTRLCRE